MKNIHSKKQRIFFICFEIGIFIIIISLAFFISFGQLFDEQSTVRHTSDFLWALGIISATDIISLITTRHHIPILIISRFRKKIKITPNNNQQLVLDSFFSNTNNDINCKTILINGIKGSGKSQITDFILDRILSKIKDSEKCQRDFWYIDCYNDSANATQTINTLCGEQLNNSLVIIDNCNEADWSIITKINELASHRNCSILIIEEDSDTFRRKLDEIENNIIETISFETYLDSNVTPSFKTFKNDLLEIRILFTFSLLCKYFNLFNYKLIKEILELKGIKFLKGKKIYRKYIKCGILKEFPLNSNNHKFVSSKSIDDILILRFQAYDEFNYVVNKIYNSNLIREKKELMWIMMLNFSYDKVKQIPWEKRVDQFNKAAQYCNFPKLLNILNDFTEENNCKNEFNYEYGYLYYNLNDFEKSIDAYNSFFEHNNWEYKIKVIELMHGCNNKQAKLTVEKYISDLKCLPLPIKFYGQYWELHIELEKGIFKIEAIRSLRKEMELYRKNNNELIEKNLIFDTHLERTFTDELRMRWIKNDLNEETNNSILEEFKSIYKEHAKFYFYDNLYFKGNYIQYIKFPEKILMRQTQVMNKNDLDHAINYYDLALNCNYGRIRSKSTAEIKKVDLEILYSDYNFLSIITTIENFRLDSEKRKSNLHIAYADTMLAKIYIVHFLANENLQINNTEKHKIITLLNNAIEIYSSFGNNYGVIRCEYILKLFNILINFDKQVDTKMNILFNTFNHIDTIEKKYINKLSINKKISYLDIYNSIKYYPIILQ